jgi:hypothetical protein
MYTTVYVYDVRSRSSKLPSRSLRVGNKELLHTAPLARNFRRHCIRHLESGEKWA